MEWKNLAITSALSLALTSGVASLVPGSARAEAEHAPTIISSGDVSLSASVEATLNNDRELPFADLFVSAKDGTVVLAGFVRSESERSRAFQDAKNVPGVKALKNNITVMSNNDY